jgi:hypothetical protein
MSESQRVSCGAEAVRGQQLLKFANLEQMWAMSAVAEHGEHDQVRSTFWNISF